MEPDNPWLVEENRLPWDHHCQGFCELTRECTCFPQIETRSALESSFNDCFKRSGPEKPDQVAESATAFIFVESWWNG